MSFTKTSQNVKKQEAISTHYAKSWPKKLTEKLSCTQKQASNHAIRNQDFPIFPMFVILTPLFANISQNHVQNMRFTEQFLIHKL